MMASSGDFKQWLTEHLCCLAGVACDDDAAAVEPQAGVPVDFRVPFWPVDTVRSARNGGMRPPGWLPTQPRV